MVVTESLLVLLYDPTHQTNMWTVLILQKSHFVGPVT